MTGYPSRSFWVYTLINLPPIIPPFHVSELALNKEAMTAINHEVLLHFSRQGLTINEGVAVDARLVQSASHPLSNEKLHELRKKRNTPEKTPASPSSSLETRNQTGPSKTINHYTVLRNMPRLMLITVLYRQQPWPRLLFMTVITFPIVPPWAVMPIPSKRSMQTKGISGNRTDPFFAWIT